MKILAIEKEIKGISEKDFTKEILKKEALRAWELYQKGSVREIYFTKDDSFAVIILEADNKEEAEKILQILPLVKEKLIAFDIYPLIPYSGFERLFE